MAKFNLIINWALIGLYTNGFHPEQKSLFAFILRCVALVSNFAVVFLSALQLIDYKGIETVAKVEQLPNSCLNFSKFVCVAYYRNDIMDILNDITQFWNLDRYGIKYKQELEVYHIFSNRFYKIYVTICLITVTMLSMKPYIVNERIIPFPGYEVCYLETSPCHEIYWGFQAYHIMCQLYPVVMAFDGLFIAFVTYIYIEIELIKYGFITVMSKPMYVINEELAMTELINIVKHHDFILRFIGKLRRIYFMVLFVKYWTTMGAMIFSLFMMTREGMPPNPDLLLKYGIYIFNLMVQFGLYCLGGHILMDQVASIPNSLFHSNWWSKKHRKLRKSIPFIIQRAQRPERLRIGKMYDLNLMTYMDLLKQVISIYTLLDKLA